MIEAPKLGSTHPVFTILLEENPDLFTTDGLEGLLMDCARRVVNSEKIETHKSLAHDCIWMALSTVLNTPGDLDLMRRILVSPSEFNIEVPSEIEEDNFYSRMGSLFGAKAMTDKFVFDIIRDNILEIQQQLNISGIKAKHKSICDRTISYHSSVGQLNLLERDLAVLSKEKDKVVNFFLEVIDLGVKYELFLEDENEEWHPYDVSKLRAIANNAISAYIRSESYKWRNTGTGWSGTSTERLYPDKIILSLGMSELGSIEERSQMFASVHPDKSRQPWLAEEE